MELSDEQKRRILDEEQQRLAEEQYRETIRQELRNETPPTAPTPVTISKPAENTRSGDGVAKVIGVAVLALAVIVLIARSTSQRSRDEPHAPSVLVTPHSQAIVSGPIVVSAGRVLYYRIPTPAYRDIHVKGHFLALGGQGNDIEAVLAEETEFGKWMDGQPCKAFYQSGRATSGDIDVKLPALSKTYYLAFNNRFSVLSPKTINADIHMDYSTLLLK
jgi:hypothetical protein